MRSLTGTLLAAQQAPLLRPAAAASVIAQHPFENRFSPLNSIPAGRDPTKPFAVTAYGAVLRFFWLDGANGFEHYYFGSPQGSMSGFADQSGGARFATSHTLIAAAQNQANPAQIAVVTAAPGASTVTVHYSTNGDASFSTETVTLNVGSGYAVAHIACCFAPDGRLFVVVQGAANLSVAVRAPAGGYTRVDDLETVVGPLQNGVACAYTVPAGQGDLAILQSASFNTGISSVSAKLFGDGGLAAAGTFTPHHDAVATRIYLGSPNNFPGSILTLGGMTLADTLRATFYEDTQNPVSGYAAQRNYVMSYSSAQRCRDGFAREPQALPVTSTSALQPVWDTQAQVFFYANANTIYWALPPTQTDLSPRLLHATRREAEHGTDAHLLLDNTDSSLDVLLSDEGMGMRVQLDLGYTTAVGAEIPACAPLFVASASATGQPGSRYTELVTTDAWGLLASWRPRRAYNWIPGQNSVLQIIDWILARCGLPIVYPASPSTLLTTTPAFTIAPADDGARAVHALLDMVPEVLVWKSDGAHLVNPQPTDPAVYTYSPTSHQVLRARRTQQPQGINHVLLYGRASGTATSPSLLAEAADPTDTIRLTDYAFIVNDLQVSVANAAARAAVPLRKAQMLRDAGEIAAAPNAGLEIWDVVSITDPFTNHANSLRRVRAIHTELNLLVEGGLYTQSVGLCNV